MQKANLEEGKVEIIEIWMPTYKGGDAYDFKNKVNLKKVVMLANGQPLYIENNFAVEKRYIMKKEFELLTKQKE